MHVGSSSLTRDQTHVPCIGRRILNHCATREVPKMFFLEDQLFNWKEITKNEINFINIIFFNAMNANITKGSIDTKIAMRETIYIFLCCIILNFINIYCTKIIQCPSQTLSQCLLLHSMQFIAFSSFQKPLVFLASWLFFLPSKPDTLHLSDQKSQPPLTDSFLPLSSTFKEPYNYIE